MLEPAWPHLQVVYEFFLRFIVSSEVNAKVAKRCVPSSAARSLGDENSERLAHPPLLLLLLLLLSPRQVRRPGFLLPADRALRARGPARARLSQDDPAPHLRQVHVAPLFIRKTISNVFYRFVYETERHNGIGELLEILGSIINGFAIPLKKEHLQFLQRALIPLHIPKCVTLYHQQLSYCIIQFVEKDADTAIPILGASSGTGRGRAAASRRARRARRRRAAPLLRARRWRARVPHPPLLTRPLTRATRAATRRRRRSLALFLRFAPHRYS